MTATAWLSRALIHEIEGAHAIIGTDLARRCRESAKIVNAIAARPERLNAESVQAPLGAKMTVMRELRASRYAR
jgi:HD superfamily phosphodiesterase